MSELLNEDGASLGEGIGDAIGESLGGGFGGRRGGGRAADEGGRGRAVRLAIGAGYVLFFLAALLVALIVTFPTRQLKAYVEGAARQQGIALRIGEMSLRGIGGVTLDDVDVVLPPSKPKPGEKEGKRLALHFDRLALGVALWSALSKKVYNVRFDMEVAGGVIEGGHALVTPLDAAAEAEQDDKDAKSQKGAKGRSRGDGGSSGVRRGYAVDLDIAAIDRLPLGKLGISPAVLGFQDKLRGALDGALSGSVKIHWGGSAEDFEGNIDLALTDAVLRKPSVELPKMGWLDLADLRMGTLTAKVTIDKKAKIAILKAARGSDKSTAIALEGVDIFGPDIELVVEERSHLLVPPGPAGFKLATMQVHFAFSLPDAGKGAAPKAKAEDGAEGEGAAAASERAKWSSIMELAGDKLRPFMRNGYVGMTCSGSVAHPKCGPAMPQVNTGTRRQARSDKADKDEKGDKGDKGDRGERAGKDEGTGGSDEAAKSPPADAGRAQPPEPPPTAPGRGETVEMKPVMRDAPTLPRPAPALGGVQVDQNVGRGRGEARPEPPAEQDEGQGGEEGEEPEAEEAPRRGRGVRAKSADPDDPEAEGEAPPEGEEPSAPAEGEDEEKPEEAGDEP